MAHKTDNQDHTKRGSQEQLLHEAQALQQGEEKHPSSHIDLTEDDTKKRLEQELLQNKEQQRAER